MLSSTTSPSLVGRFTRRSRSEVLAPTSLRRTGVGIELNEQYIEIAMKRLRQEVLPI